MRSENCINTQYTYRFEGGSGIADMQLVMKMFRCGFKTLGGIRVESVLDHSKERRECKSDRSREMEKSGCKADRNREAEATMPDCRRTECGTAETRESADSVEYRLAGGSSVEIRPSGSELIIEVVISVADGNIEKQGEGRDNADDKKGNTSNVTDGADDRKGYTSDGAIRAIEYMQDAALTEKRIREDLENIIYMDSRMGYCCE